jgi:branched-chain amino acid transport system permease protein
VFWLGFLVLVVLVFLSPEVLSRYQIINFSNFLISGLLALSLALIWGYCGILSLGQAAFHGIGGYAYGIIALNLLNSHGNTHIALIGGILAPVAFAAVVGAVMFYGRLKGVYVAILMLVVSLLLGLFMRQTADPMYTVGAAYLGGMNGLRPASPDDPLLPSLIFGIGEAVVELDGRSYAFFYFVLAIVVVVYLLLRCLVNSSYGYLLIGCREDPDRTETFGYDVRLIQLSVFCLSAAIAGLSGTLYTAWGTYIHPDGFSVATNILVVIWVAVGWRKDLGAALLGSILLNWISLRLASVGEVSLLVLGCVLVGVMLIAPEGLIVTFGRWMSRRMGRQSAASKSVETAP